jgi:tetratricopeptide (TPR) repeat protein
MDARRGVRAVGELLFPSGAVGVFALALVGVLRTEGAHALLLSATALLSATHVGVTLMRARHAHKLSMALAAIGLSLGGAAIVVNGGLEFFEVLYLVLAFVLPAHVALQSFRAATILTLRNGGQVQRAASLVAVVVGALASVIAALSGPRELLAVRGALSTSTGTVVWLVLCAVSLVAAWRATLGTRAGIRVTVALALPPSLAGAPLLLGAAVPPDWSLGGPLAVSHAAQLIALAFMLEPRVARLEERSFDPAAHLAGALGLGVLLLIDLPLLAARVSHGDPTTWILAVTGAVALAHALLDVPLWSLKDTTLLRAAGEAIVPAAHGRHAVGNVRAIAFAVPLALVLAIAAFEPMQSILVRRGDREGYALARTLFPEDVRLLVAEAGDALAADDTDGARAALDRARGALSADALRLGVVLCVREQEDTGACFDALPAALRDDVELAAVEVVELDAQARFLDAVAVARRVAGVHQQDARAAALAGAALARVGDAAARAALEAGLALAWDEAAASDPLLVRAATWRGRLALEAGHRDEAHEWLERARVAVVALDLPDLGLLVFGALARLQDERGDAPGALEHWKVALGAAQDTDRPFDEAEAYLGLYDLLTRSAASPAARYACVFAAERALGSVFDSDLSRRARTRAADARRDVTPYLSDDNRQLVEAGLDSALADLRALSYPSTPPPGQPSAPGLVDGGPADKNAPP